MHKRYHLNACVKLQPTTDKALNICEVGAEVDAKFIGNLNKLYGEIVFSCVKLLHTSKLNKVSVKLMPMGKKFKITANVLLAEDENKKFAKEEDRYRKVEFTDDHGQIKGMDIHRLIKYMEAKAMMNLASNFDSLIHVRVVPCEQDDVFAKQF